MSKQIFSYTSKTKYYDKLYFYASILENRGHLSLLPLDIKGNLPGAEIYEYTLASRGNKSLEDLRHERICISDALIIYADPNDEEPIDYNMMTDILYAVHQAKDIFVIWNGADGYKITEYIEEKTLGITSVSISGERIVTVNLDDWYRVKLKKLDIQKIDDNKEE